MRQRSAALALLALLAWGLPGCALIDANKTKLRISHVPSNPLDKKSPRHRFVEAVGKARDPSGAPFGLALAPIELWAPFTIDLSVGVFDLDALEASFGATACLELQAGDDLGQPVAFICADFLQGLTQTRSSVDEGLVEEHFAVFEVAVQLEADGQTLFFRSRERGADDWIEVASMPFTQTGELLPGISVSNLLKKGRLGFDDFQLVMSGAAPVPPTDADLVAEHLQAMLLSSYEACTDLDGADIDLVAATGKLDDALASLASAAIQLQLLPETKTRRKAAKKIAQTEKKTRSALAKIDKGKVEPAIKRVQQSMRSGAEAILLIEPRSL